ncbi:MAG: adenylate/guanylate cyclase domain-containing protein [Actinomycetaceae bacterium]|nr:adenylate/guanylate cyclase domain-containing protein [Actinomycetaceae bacterium]
MDNEREGAPGFREEKKHQGTVERHVEELIGGPSIYTVKDVEERTELNREEIFAFWRSLGFPRIKNPDTDLIFTDQDVEAMRQHAKMMNVTKMRLSDDAVHILMRAQSQMMDRLVLWQQEAFVEYAEHALGLDGISARFWMLDHISDFTDFLSSHMSYAWKRHLAALLRRTEIEIGTMKSENNNGVQLQRALGFIDMVSFTRLSREMDTSELIALIETFDRLCRDIITTRGARVVKTIGDAFLYIADSVEIAADVATTIVRKMQEVESMPPVHASLVWGGVVSRFGDVFGSTVNLASRLGDVAQPNTVLTDVSTAHFIMKKKLPYRLTCLGNKNLKGLGETEIFSLEKI